MHDSNYSGCIASHAFASYYQIHIVHRKVGASGNDNLAVFGILYNETDDGMHNEVFDKLWCVHTACVLLELTCINDSPGHSLIIV